MDITEAVRQFEEREAAKSGEAVASGEIVPEGWLGDLEDVDPFEVLDVGDDIGIIESDEEKPLPLSLPVHPVWKQPSPIIGYAHRLPPEMLAQLPPIVRNAGEHAAYGYVEFFAASIRNAHTRRAYAHAVNLFLAWCERHGLELTQISSLAVATYIEQLPASAPTVKLHLAAVKKLFDHLVVRHVLSVNPASAVRGPKHVVKKGKTPVLTGSEAQRLLDSIDVSNVVGLRDRAMIGLMIYSFARIGAVTKIRVRDYYQSGKRWWVRLHEKGGKFHEVPVHHIAEEYLDAYLEVAGLEWDRHSPLFRSTRARSGVLTSNSMSENDALRMIKRRAVAAGLSPTIGCHSCRATGITAYLQHGGTLEKAQQIANHESPKTTKLYDRTQDHLTVDEIERIRLD